MTERDIARAFAHCERITRTRARNFWYGICLLPRHKRRALAAVYAMSRRIDDAADDDGLPLAEKRRRLEAIDAALATLDRAASHRDPVLTALGDAAGRFALPTDAFADLVAGVRMDVDGVRYETFDDLLVYCRRVAGSVGRLSLAVFGSDGMPGLDEVADDLGVAMQLTNVLRDVREDGERGRVYLPAEDLARFGLRPDDPLAATPPDGAAEVVRFEVARARRWFERGLGLLAHLDRRSAACAGSMAGIYVRLLDRIERDPVAVFATRVALSGREKAWVAARCLAGGRPGSPTRARSTATVPAAPEAAA